MPSQLIDDKGAVWPACSRRLRESFDSPYSGGEFVDYAVVNLGFAGVDTYNRACQVRVRPEFVEPETAAALQAWLAQCGLERVVVTWFDGDWRRELMSSPAQAWRRLEHLLTQARPARPGDFVSRPVGQHELHARSPLGRIVGQWGYYAVPAGRTALMGLLRQTLGDRYVIVREGRGGRLVFAEFGSAMFADYDTWRMCAVGAPIEEQPDRDYGRWVADAYRETLARGQPSIADVDAIVRWPHAGRCRMRYKRVIVPLASASDPPALLGGPLFDDRIDLRIGAGG